MLISVCLTGCVDIVHPSGPFIHASYFLLTATALAISPAGLLLL
jgi:hypothetical protein